MSKKQNPSNEQIHPAFQQYYLEALLRLPQVLALVPVSRSTWWSGVKSGRFPQPVKLGPRTTAWRYRDVKPLCDSGLSQDEGVNHE